MFEFHSQICLIQTRLELIEQQLSQILHLLEQQRQQQVTATATTAQPHTLRIV
jgi:hypothetical protein